MGMHFRHKSGFTIVELAVVISVIGILASITVVGYGAWQKRTTVNVVSSDLFNAASAMENARNFGNAYPTSFPATFQPSSNVVLEMVTTATGKYCINAYSTRDTSVRMSIYSDNARQTRDYTCAGTTIGSPIGGSIPATPTGVNIAPSFASWTLSGGATYNSSTGELILGSSGTAVSPKVRVNGVAGVNINAEFYATTQSGYAGNQPYGSWYSGTQYFTSDGTTPATNTWGYQANGCAPKVNLNSWTVSAMSNCVYALGNNVTYFTLIVYGSNYTYPSPDLKIRNMTFIPY